MAELDVTIMRRLAFIRYLLKVGVEQSYQPEPMAASSVLTLHDSVELFLTLAAEHLGAQVQRNTTFTEYWTILNAKLTPSQLSQQASMRRLNTARTSLKHSGILPNKHDIEAFRVNATGFFDENARLVFGRPLDDISMLDLVDSERAKASLQKATKLRERGDLEGALADIAIAYDQVIHDYAETKRTRFGGSPFGFGWPLSEALPMWDTDGLGGLAPQYNDLYDAVRRIQKAMQIVALGIDYRRYVKFDSLTPYVTWFPGGQPFARYPEGYQPTSDAFDYCYDFVIESAIHLQEFEFAIA